MTDDSRPPAERDVDDELGHHLDARERLYRQQGLAPDEARRRAREKFGDVDRVRATVLAIDRRETGGWAPGVWMTATARASRRLRRQWGISATTVLALGLGIGLSAAALSPFWRAVVVDLPIDEPDRVVSLWETSESRGWTDAPASPDNLTDWLARGRSLESLAFYSSSRDRASESSEVFLGGPDGGQLMRTLDVSTNLFDVLGVRPTLGRGFRESDAIDGAPKVIVLGHRVWQARFDGDPGVIGRTVVLDEEPHVVVGVAPASFWFPGRRVDGWVARGLRRTDFGNPRLARVFRVVARLAPGVSIGQAREDLARVAADLRREYPGTNEDTGVGISTLSAWLAGPQQNPLGLAALAGGIILFIALANAALMAWTSLAARERDLVVQRALGARLGRLFLETVVESGVVTALAVAVAVPVGVVALAGAAALDDTGGVVETLDGGALASVALASFAGLSLVGVFALRTVSRPAASLLAADGRTPARGLPPGGRLATIAQVAVTFLLAVGAVGALRGFSALASVPTGVRTDSAVTATVTLRAPRFRDEALVARYVRDALDRIRVLPGVTAVGATGMLPLHGQGYTSFIWIPDLGVENVEIRHREITDGYAAAAGIPIVEGREFLSSDGAEDPVLLVSEAFVARITGGRSPVGMTLTYASPERARRIWRIVGVIGDTRMDARDGTPVPMIYQPHALNAEETMTIVARSASPEALGPELQRILHEIDPDAVVLAVQPFDDAVLSSLDRERSTAELASLVAVVALVLACIGLYALSSLEVRRQRPELAVRIVLGARPGQLARLLWVRTLWPVMAGLGLGAGLAVLAGPAARAAVPLIDPTPADAAIAAVFLLVAVVLALGPNVRLARRTDPNTLIRVP